ncbi:MAG: MarR family transcriptional regulator [Treponema sp.]|jgi:DNA-binding MarR family transcriptional regulator|nr:MarR family transcriptional regulator [Treponema sp.]
MDEQLTKGLIETFLRFKRIKMPIPPKTGGGKQDLSVMETVLLKKISEGSIDGFCDLEEECHVSKSAVSQMVGVLEEKGFITRDIDKTNRRKRLLGLTPKGRGTVDTIGKEMDAYFAGIIQRFGENDTRLLVSLCNRFAEIVEERSEKIHRH